MDAAELNRLTQLPGPEGALWRLIRIYDPDKLSIWIRHERSIGNLHNPEQAVHCLAELMSGFGFALAYHVGGDKNGALFGDKGLLKQFEALLRHKMQQVGGAHKIVTVKPNKLNVPL